MENNTLGRILRENREKQKLSKQKVCRGLCTVMALSRYESDERIPDKFLMDALLERLGFQPSKYEFVASDQEFEYSMKRAQIEKLLYEKRDVQACREALQEYEKQVQEKERLHRQYILLKKGLILGREEKYSDAINVFEQALKCTECSETNVANQTDILLTNTETELLYLIGKFLYIDGKKKDACTYFRMLKNQMEQRPAGKEKWKEYYPCILYRLAQCEFEAYNYGTSYELILQAEKVMIENYEYDCLYEVLELKEIICARLGIAKKTNENLQLALKLMAMGENGKFTKEGLNLWENTASQQL